MLDERLGVKPGEHVKIGDSGIEVSGIRSPSLTASPIA